MDKRKARIHSQQLCVPFLSLRRFESGSLADCKLSCVALILGISTGDGSARVSGGEFLAESPTLVSVRQIAGVKSEKIVEGR